MALGSRSERGSGARGAVWLAGWALALAVLYVPFWGKAFHIDDGAYLHLSTLYEWNPLEVHASDYVYLGVLREGLLPYESSHPFLVPYLIKAATSVLGRGEVALHAFFTLFALLAMGGLVALDASLFPRGARYRPLLLAFFLPLPVFLVTSHSVMTDMPTLAFWLWAIALYVRLLERPTAGRAAAAGLAMLGALACSYQAVLVLPALFAYALLSGRLSARFLAALATPCVAFLGWLLAVYSRYGVFPFLAQPESGFSVAEEVERATGGGGAPAWAFGSKAIHMLAVLGTAFGILLALRAVLAREGLAFLRRLAVGTAVFLAVVHFFLDAYGPRELYDWGELLLLAVLMTLGSLGLLLAARGSGIEVRSDHGSKMAFLVLWPATVMVFNLVLLPFSAARYHLFAVPPLFLLLWHGVPWNALRQHRRAVLAAGAGTVLFGLASAWADYRQANAYRELAYDLRAAEPEAGLWYIGEWGLRHYMEEVGGRYVRRDLDETAVGDRVVIADMHRRFSWPPESLSRRVDRDDVERVAYGDALPLRLFSARSQAGFWAHGFGLLPFALSFEPFETVEVYRVVRGPDE